MHGSGLQQTVEQVEQRRFSRVPLDLAATCSTRDGYTGALAIGNVGAGGIGGRLGARLEPGTAVAVKALSADGLRVPVDLVGRVQWQAAQRGDAGWWTGIQLLDDEWDSPAGLDELMRAALWQAQEEDRALANEVRGVAVMNGTGRVWTVRFQPVCARR